MSKNLKEFIPADLNIWVSGNPGNVWGDRIIQQIFAACMKESKTIEEIAEEVCMASVYFEDTLKEFTERKFFKVTQGGKYLVDFVIYPEQPYEDFKYEISELYSNITKPLTDRLYKIKDKICGVGFYGSDMDFEYLLWPLYVYASNTLGGLMQEKNKSKWAGKVAENNGKPYRIAASVTYPGETIKSRGKQKRVTWSNIHCGFNTPNHGKVTLANLYDYAPFTRDRHTWINDQNINLLLKIFDNAEYTPDEYEKEYAANFISRDIVKNKGGKLYLNMPVLTEAQQKAIRDLLAVELEDIAEEYAAKAAEICDRILLPLTREDLLEEYANWITWGAFAVLPYLFYENKYLQIPEDYNASAAGLCLYTSNSGIYI